MSSRCQTNVYTHIHTFLLLRGYSYPSEDGDGEIYDTVRGIGLAHLRAPPLMIHVVLQEWENVLILCLKLGLRRAAGAGAWRHWGGPAPWHAAVSRANARGELRAADCCLHSPVLFKGQTWALLQQPSVTRPNMEQLLAVQETQEFGLKVLKKKQREIATTQKKKDAAAVAEHVERQQKTKEQLARLQIAAGHYENWKADNQTVVAFRRHLCW